MYEYYVSDNVLSLRLRFGSDYYCRVARCHFVVATIGLVATSVCTLTKHSMT